VADRKHVVFGVDTPYAPHLSAALRSLERASGAAGFVCHILHEGMPSGLRERVGADARGLEINWIDTSVRLRGLAGRDQFSRATYHRLTIPEVLDPQARRALYLDSDLIVHRDIRPLFGADLGGAPIGAVCDAGETPESIDSFARKWSLEGERRYFNAGVLLLDLDALRRSGAFSEAMRIALSCEADLQWLDQDALNIVFWNRWRALDPIWNIQTAIANSRVRIRNDELAQARGRVPRIVHFTGKNKPWKAGEWTPYAALYWRALSGSNFWRETARAARLSMLGRLKAEARWMRRRVSLRE